MIGVVAANPGGEKGVNQVSSKYSVENKLEQNPREQIIRQILEVIK
jgi:hypothetical protein